MDQKVKESVDNGLLQNRHHHPVVAWPPGGADEGSLSSIESIIVGDLVYNSTDVSLSSFQKRGGGGATHLPDQSSFSEDEEALDPTYDGSPVSYNKWKKHLGYSSAAHINVSTNINDVPPDESSMHSEDYSFHRVKLLCSYGGKILPRPTDKELRYVGGDTRLITVSRDIHLHELMQKMAELYALVCTIKYKLPEEDLDALVSVSSNEDVANMMEEYDRLQSSSASPRLRLFLFSDMDHESVHPNESFGEHRSTEQRYVYAVNGISESFPKKYLGDGGSLAIAPVVIVDSLNDVGEPWGLIRQQDTIPVAMLAPQISQDVASLIHHVPVALPVSSIPPTSAPSSAPSSPPLKPRVMKQGLIPEMRLSFHSDQHSNLSGHQYNIVQADGAVLEGDSHAINVPTGSTMVHEHKGVESPRKLKHKGVESPRKLKHDGDSLLHQEQPVARDDVRRLPEVRMPRVLSHGKLTRLVDHHSEASAPVVVRQRHTYQQQPQPSQQQHGGWQPNLYEEQTHVFGRRAEIIVQSSTSDVVAQPVAPGQQQLQLQLPHIRSPFLNVSAAPIFDQPVYRPVDHLTQGEEVFAPPFMQRSISVHTMGPLGSTTTAVTSFNAAAVVSAPSSPRTNHRDPLSIHASGQSHLQQQQQVLRSHAAPNYAEQQQQHGLRHQARSDSATRLGPVTSPPRYRDHLGQTDERLLRPLQQPVLATTDGLGLQSELFLYDGHSSAYGQYSEGVAKVSLPQYLGYNPFQESPSSFAEPSPSETQDGGDGRRYRENASQKLFHPLHFNARDDLQDESVSSSAEPRSIQARYQEKPMNRVVHQRGRDVDESTSSWRGGGRGRTGQYEEVNEDGVADVDAAGGRFLHLPEDSEDLLVVSDSYCPRSIDMGEPLSTNNPQYRSTVIQSHMMSLYPSTHGQASVVDMPQVPPYVGLESEPGFLVEPTPRSVKGILELGSTPALVEVSHLPSEIISIKSLSSTNMDDKAAIGSFNNFVPHLSSASSTRVGNTESVVNIAELRWGETNDVIESRINLQARDSSSTILDQFQRLSGSGGAQGRLSEASVGTRIEVSEELALQRSHDNSTIPLGDDDSMVEEKNNSVAYDLRNPILNDGMTPIIPQLSISEGQAQALQPMTTKATVPNVGVYASSAVGPSVTEQETASVGPLLFNSGSPAPRISQSDIYGVSGQNAENRRNDNKMLTSQTSAAGHIAEDIASSVLVSSMREMLVSQPSASNMQAQEDKEKWLSFSQEDATGVVVTNLIHAPTFSAPNWDSLQNHPIINTEIDDAQTQTFNATAKSEEFGSQPPIEVEEKLRSIEDLVPEGLVPIHDDLEQSSSNPGSAEDAEAEAIRSGLQTILNADLEEMRELGSGTFGTVYHGKWRGTDVAIKRIKSSCFAGRPAERDRLIADFWREACTLSQLHHPNVVAFYGVVRDGPGGTLATVTEYMVNGSLKQVLQKKDRTIDRRKRLLIAMDAAFGMEYLHSKNIVHFDLKCDNLLVNMRDSHRPICKVGDLGLSKVKHQTMVSGGVRGTLPWMAPELLNGSSTLVTEKVDVFSFGIVMWELLTGEEPYASMHYGAIIGGIVNNTLRPSIPSWCDPLWKSLMEKCWSAEPTCRPSFSEIASELRVMATALQPKAHVAQ